MFREIKVYTFKDLVISPTLNDEEEDIPYSHIVSREGNTVAKCRSLREAQQVAIAMTQMHLYVYIVLNPNPDAGRQNILGTFYSEDEAITEARIIEAEYRLEHGSLRVVPNIVQML